MPYVATFANILVELVIALLVCAATIKSSIAMAATMVRDGISRRTRHDSASLNLACNLERNAIRTSI